MVEAIVFVDSERQAFVWKRASSSCGRAAVRDGHQLEPVGVLSGTARFLVTVCLGLEGWQQPVRTSEEACARGLLRCMIYQLDTTNWLDKAR